MIGICMWKMLKHIGKEIALSLLVIGITLSAVSLIAFLIGSVLRSFSLYGTVFIMTTTVLTTLISTTIFQWLLHKKIIEFIETPKKEVKSNETKRIPFNVEEYHEKEELKLSRIFKK